LIGETEDAFGGHLLVDCHSMPSAAGSTRGQNSADIVLGDCRGASCARQIVEAASGFLVDRGFVVAINSPYAGEFTTGSYWCPRAHRHALQIEISRALYMDEQSYRRKHALLGWSKICPISSDGWVKSRPIVYQRAPDRL
jgi:N-formylglutamate amidohydrolase